MRTTATRKKVGKEKVGTREMTARQTKTLSRIIFNGHTQAGITLRRPHTATHYLGFHNLAMSTTSLPRKLPSGSAPEKMGSLKTIHPSHFPLPTTTTKSLLTTHPTISLCLLTPPPALTAVPGFLPEPMNYVASSPASRSPW